MKRFSILFTVLFICMVAGIGIYAKTSNEKKIKGEEISYTLNGKTFKGYIAYDDAKKGERPAVLVVHEWWGCNDYVRMRARKLAELGYIAMAVDMYGDGKLAANPQEAQKLSGEIYGDMQLLKSRMQAAEQKLKTYSQADGNNIAAIGYCFGGSVVLNAAKLGMDFKGIASFHGGLQGVSPDKNSLQANILVCHGGSDKFISDEEINKFKKEMDSVAAPYTFKVYPGATHAFTNPDATELGKKFNLPIAYNEIADKNSWADMKTFFAKIFKK